MRDALRYLKPDGMIDMPQLMRRAHGVARRVVAEQRDWPARIRRTPYCEAFGAHLRWELVGARGWRLAYLQKMLLIDFSDTSLFPIPHRLDPATLRPVPMMGAMH